MLGAPFVPAPFVRRRRMPFRLRSAARAVALAVLLAAVPACRTSAPPPTPPEAAPPAAPAHAVIPQPASITLDGTAPFVVAPETAIYVDAGDADLGRIGRMLSDLLGTVDAPGPEVRERPAGDVPAGSIVLTTAGADAALGPEGYALTVTAEGVEVHASEPAGVFYGVQTLRHLLPPYVEYAAARPQPRVVPAVRVEDAPRYAWRGAMLDVARHFRTVDEVKRYVDLMALYKLNRLHLHLSDDQGWRIQIRAWPALTEVGAATEVGGGPGGYYSQTDYAEIVRYAAERHVTVVPEIDMPGHINAALAAVPELNCDGQAREPYTGIRVGFSALCLEKDVTYTFIDDVVRELAALTPGPYLHFGGDEVRTLEEADYAAFVQRVQRIIARHGKRPIGWDEIAPVDAPEGLPPAVIQWWRPTPSVRAALAAAAARGHRIIASPADRVYLDMKFDSTTALGLRWAGLTDVATSYDADPAARLAEVPEEAVLGIEAPLWAETTETMADVEYLAFPRLAGVAEVGWSPRAALDWDAYRVRLGRQAPRWTALGVNFYRDPAVPWE